MVDSRSRVRGKRRATGSYFSFFPLSLVLIRRTTFSLSSTTSSAQNGSYRVADAETTKNLENRDFVSSSMHKWHEDHSLQCGNLLLPEVLPVRYASFAYPKTAVGVSCIPTAAEITREQPYALPQVQQARIKNSALHVFPPNKSCPRCRTGPWPASDPNFACWTMWSPRFTCWDEMMRLFGALELRNFTWFYKDWAGGHGQTGSRFFTKFVFVAALTLLCSFVGRWTINANTKSSSQEMTVLLRRQRRAIKRFARAVDSLFRKIVWGEHKRKRVVSVRRINRMREVEQNFRSTLRRLIRRRNWTLRELPPSRLEATSEQQVADSGQGQAEKPQQEEVKRWSLRWLQLNAMHMMLLPVKTSASEAHPYVQEQRADEEKLFKYWHKVYNKRVRKLRQRGWTQWKNSSHTGRQANTGLSRGAVQELAGIAKADACQSVSDDLSTRLPLPIRSQDEMEGFQRYMRDIFHAFVKDASEWRYWQRTEQLNFIEVVMNQLERWRKLQLSFEGGILESTFKLTIMTNSIVRRFQNISVFLTEEEMKGSRIIRQATSRGKGTGAAVVDAHSSTWAHLTEAALDARFVRQMKFLRTQFEEQKKMLNSTSHTRQVEHSLEQVCQDHLRSLTASLQKSFEQQVEKHLTQNVHQQPPPVPSARIKKELEELKDIQKKLFERSHALAAAAQENIRQNFQDQQQQMDRMSTKLHMILDRHVEQDTLQEQKLQQLLDACLEKHQKHLVTTLGKTTSQGNTATATLLQQQNELRRICEAQKDQGERISHMVETFIRQQKVQQSALADKHDICSNLESKLASVLREELQAARQEMVEAVRETQQQNSARKCPCKEEYHADIKRVVDSVTSLLQQQRQEHRSLHETLLIQRRDTLELLKHFTHLGVPAGAQQPPSSAACAAAVPSNIQTFVDVEAPFSGDNRMVLLQASRDVRPRRVLSVNPGFHRKMRGAEGTSLGSTVIVNKQGLQQLHHGVTEKFREGHVFLSPFLQGQSLPLVAEESSSRDAVPTHREASRQKDVSLQQAPFSWAQHRPGAQEQSEKFEQLLERWTRSITDAEAMERPLAKLSGSPNNNGNLSGSTPRHPDQAKQGSNVAADAEQGDEYLDPCRTWTRHVGESEPYSVDKVAQLFCVGQLNSSESRSVADLTSPAHELQSGGYQTEKNSVIPSSREALADLSRDRENSAGAHRFSLAEGRDHTHPEVDRDAQQQHQQTVLKRELLHQTLLAPRQDPGVTQQCEDLPTSDLQNLILDWDEDWM